MHKLHRRYHQEMLEVERLVKMVLIMVQVEIAKLEVERLVDIFIKPINISINLILMDKEENPQTIKNMSMEIRLFLPLPGLKVGIMFIEWVEINPGVEEIREHNVEVTQIVLI